jgi:hypothetical protein
MQDLCTSRRERRAALAASRLEKARLRPVIFGKLHYYRCVHCLEVFTAGNKLDSHKEEQETDGSRKRYIWMTDAQCCCLGRIQWMGQVSQDNTKLVREVERPVCDGRCTAARGPECYCFCECANHGSGMTVLLEEGAGLIPRPQFSDSTQAAIIARGNNYTALLDAVTELLRKSTRLDSNYDDNWADYNKARKMLVYSRRTKLLQKVYRRLSADGADFVQPFIVNEPVLPKLPPIYFPSVGEGLSRTSSLRQRQKKSDDQTDLIRHRRRNEVVASPVLEHQETAAERVLVRIKSITSSQDTSRRSKAVKADRAERVAALEQMLNEWFAAPV